MENQIYYLRIKGRITGPHDLAHLQNLVRRGSLARVHEVSRDRLNWMRANELEGLFPSAADVSMNATPAVPTSALGNEERRPNAPTRPSKDPLGVWSAVSITQPADRAADRVRRAGRLNVVTGVCVAAVLLFSVMVPHARSASGLVWWWDLFAATGVLPVALLATWVLLVSLALPAVALLTREVARGWAYAGLASSTLLMMLVLAVFVSVPATAVAVSFLLVGAGATITAAEFFRVLHPRLRSGRIVLISTGVVSIVSGLAAAALFAWGMLQFKVADTIPDWAIAFTVFWAVGCLCGTASGVVGFSTLSRGNPEKVRLVVMLLSLAGAFIFLITFFVFSFRASTLLPSVYGEGRFIVVQFLRLSVVAFELAGLLGTGVWELLICYANESQRKNMVNPVASSEVQTC